MSRKPGRSIPSGLNSPGIALNGLSQSPPAPFANMMPGKSDLQSHDIVIKQGRNPPSLIVSNSMHIPIKPEPDEPQIRMSRSRLSWLILVWLLTFYIPVPLLSLCGMKDKNRRIAWREKVAIFILILGVNSIVVLLIVGVGQQFSTPPAILGPDQINTFTSVDNARVFMYGKYYSVSASFIKSHSKYSPGGVEQWISTTLGKDVSQMFPKDTFKNTYCGDGTQPYFPTQPATFPVRSPNLISNAWSVHVGMDLLPGLKNSSLLGTVVWTKELLQKYNQSDPTHKYVIISDRIYDVGSIYYGMSGNSASMWGALFDAVFLADNASLPGSDVTDAFNSIVKNDANKWRQALYCLDNMYYVGDVDHRNDPKCQDIKCRVQGYLLIAVSAILLLVIAIKFFAALDCTRKKASLTFSEKFVIMFVPCYSEGEASLRRTIDTLSTTTYRDKYKLLFIVCDGVVTGAGNSKDTPSIVLDMLGCSATDCTEHYAFESVGEGDKRLNFAKVYAGLYCIEGQKVPFVVVVKVGQSNETTKAGNRGKRDSQLILMRFLSKVALKSPMYPLELQIYHLIHFFIGANPSFYEYILMVDADTSVDPESLNIMVSNMIQFPRISGMCGETKVFNKQKSWCTVSQVYEYYISHNLSKAFESTFGSVTCLPGCFSLYRIRNLDGPVLVDPCLINDYAVNEVNTLHLKNLLHLGEDRFMTTLLLKYFPSMKTVFRRAAIAYTVVPETWSILFSQRRRWINSTVHNMAELLFLKNLCGFCIFNMRFIVLLDLFGTITGLASFIYIGYLIYCVVNVPEYQFPLISVIIVACAYGLQLLILLVNRKWEQIIWFIFNLVASPIFNLVLPLYAFWNMDDFSWGNTRKTEGELTASDKTKSSEGQDFTYIDQIPTYSILEYAHNHSLRPDQTPQNSTRSAPNVKQGTEKDSSTNLTYANLSILTPYLKNSNQSTPSFRDGTPRPTNDNDVDALSAGPEIALNSLPSLIPSSAPHKDEPFPTFSAMTTAPEEFAIVPLSLINSQSAPSDEQLLAEIRHILEANDLTSITKKSVRLQLSNRFGGMDLTARRAFINGCIDQILRGNQNIQS